ncbi:MAG: glycosyltransferase family 2 protein [Prosthecobacter sp.]|uniref:glycosyltransferase family 2 protein n=1 Tax=Prosthecobacter sp. TaxID=1965333 RepID=UPI00262D6E18|nr:glycosyltransferase family 2 protein [Prosthecobacter sp.]MCF7789785.1 glycosyltransferase family 2 protein [Prosthecobacter sp.]
MEATETTPEVSFVVPLYNTGEGLQRLLDVFRALSLPETWELVLVDDGSVDGSAAAARLAVADFPAPVTVVELARNFGEHAAVLEGYRHARGEFVVNLDDDLQNPPGEAVKLVRHLRESGAEVVYSRYAEKKHPWARNVASWLANCCATFLLGKPQDLYLSSFRALRRDLVERIVVYRGPYPYVDGLILGATNRIATLEVAHVERQGGQSGYTPRKLIRLLLSLLFDFSVMPLRIASVLGVLLCVLGALILAEVLLETLFVGQRQLGWGSLMGALAVFSGAQLLMLGLIGEYVGRAFLTVSGKPQSLVRTLTTHMKPPSA